MEDEKINQSEKLSSQKERVKDLIIFLNKISDEDLLKYTLEEMVEGYWQSLYKAAEEESNFNLDGE
jgi:hypothetical protein